MSKASVINSGFPTTTASAIATMTTGVASGTHGLVGYRVRDPANDRMVNQLNGWDAGMDPATWQPVQTVFERSAAAGIPSFSIGPARFAASGFSQAVLRGSAYVSAASVVDRFAAARAVLERNGRALVYVYVPELDTVAHKDGWESDKWLALLEDLDHAVSVFASGLRAGDGLLVTADHGILDVPQTAHVLFDKVPELIEGVRQIGGEPRCLQLYLDPQATDADRDALAAAWRSSERTRAWVATRSQACDAGWFGSDVRPDAVERMGDVLVAARSRVAYYDSREQNLAPRRMIGQHGSLSQDEMRVPLIRLGAFAPAGMR